MAKKVSKVVKKGIRKPVPRKPAPAAVEEVKDLQDLFAIPDAEWAGTEAAAGGGGFPAAKGQTCFIEEAEVTTSQAGNPIVKWVLRGSDESNDGLVDFKNDGLKTEKNRSFLRRDMEAIGLPWPSSASELGEVLQAAIGMEIKVDVVDKNDYHNIYFRDSVGDPASDAANDPGKDAANDDSEILTRDDLEGLGSQGDEGDKDAISVLTEYAKDCKIDPGDYATWADLAEALMDAYNL